MQAAPFATVARAEEAAIAEAYPVPRLKILLVVPPDVTRHPLWIASRSARSNPSFGPSPQCGVAARRTYLRLVFSGLRDDRGDARPPTWARRRSAIRARYAVGAEAVEAQSPEPVPSERAEGAAGLFVRFHDLNDAVVSVYEIVFLWVCPHPWREPPPEIDLGTQLPWYA